MFGKNNFESYTFGDFFVGAGFVQKCSGKNCLKVILSGIFLCKILSVRAGFVQKCSGKNFLKAIHSGIFLLKKNPPGSRPEAFGKKLLESLKSIVTFGDFVMQTLEV